MAQRNKLLAQVNTRSDPAFCANARAGRGGEVWLGRHHAASGALPQSQLRRHVATLTLGNQLREFSVLADLAQQRTKLTVGGWDVAGKAPSESADPAPSAAKPAAATAARRCCSRHWARAPKTSATSIRKLATKAGRRRKLCCA